VWRKVPRECERQRDGWVEMSSGDVPEGVDHHHDHEPERDRHAGVAEVAGLRVDHDRAAAGEHERKRPDRLRDQDAREGNGAQVGGSSRSISAATRASSSSRILRTVSTSWPAGSSSAQSSYLLPG